MCGGPVFRITDNRLQKGTEKEMTLDEIARELNLSKSTVSRALSGKGRIGDATRERVISFARERGRSREEAKPERVRTGNIGVILPADVYATGNPYFQGCLLGVCETASMMDFNILLTTATANDISNIRALVEKEKVDGIILTRSLEEDKAVQYLTDIHFPVGMTGLCGRDGVLEVDIDNEGAAEQLTTLLIGQGYQRFALVVENLSYQVNRSRYEGFCKALLKSGISREKQFFHTVPLNMELLDSLIHNIMSRRVECIVCGDDVVCTRIMARLQAEGYRIPRDIAIASLYNSSNLGCFTPAVTAVNVSARQVGNMIGKQLIQYILGKEYDPRVMMDFEILLRKSTDTVHREGR